MKHTVIAFPETNIITAKHSYLKLQPVVIGERAKRARHYQGCTNSSLCGIYIYIYIYIYMYGGTYAIIVAHATHT